MLAGIAGVAFMTRALLLLPRQHVPRPRRFVPHPPKLSPCPDRPPPLTALVSIDAIDCDVEVRDRSRMLRAHVLPRCPLAAVLVAHRQERSVVRCCRHCCTDTADNLAPSYAAPVSRAARTGNVVHHAVYLALHHEKRRGYVLQDYVREGAVADAVRAPADRVSSDGTSS